MKQLPTLFEVVGLPNEGEVRCQGCGKYVDKDTVTVVETQDWYSKTKRPYCTVCKGVFVEGI